MFQIVYSGYWLRVSSDQNPIPKRVGKRSMYTQSTHLAHPFLHTQSTRNLRNRKLLKCILLFT